MSKFFQLWSSIGEIEREMGGTYSACAAWVHRGEIPRSFDLKLLEALKRRGISLDLAELHLWHDKHAERKKAIREGSISGPQQSKIPLPWEGKLAKPENPAVGKGLPK
ncbi:hypothetical protein RSK20926_11669 [Roseobacter sp. SK209-2-6]|nr:hypothetical protein RSK20926_11669 [Roseobacter sp. SK209-2-6]